MRQTSNNLRVITVEEVQDALRKYETSHNRNPVDRPISAFSLCLYTDESGENHCLVGQVLKDLGVNPPSFESRLNHEPIRNPEMKQYLERQGFELSGEAEKLLIEAQQTADIGPSEWSVVIRSLAGRGML